MTLHSPSDTDLTLPHNVIQARFELDRAMASSGYAQLSSWAVKWGRMALDAIENPALDYDQSDLDEAEAEAERSNATAVKVIDAAETAIREIENAMSDHHPSSEFEGKLNAALNKLEQAL